MRTRIERLLNKVSANNYKGSLISRSEFVGNPQNKQKSQTFSWPDRFVIIGAAFSPDSVPL
jgi:hypothetical protein